MKRVVFFVEPEWAYGVIHYDLSKWLQRHNIRASVMPWNRQYTFQEVQDLAQHIDYFVSTPYGLEALCIHHYGIQPEQCIVVCHSREDVNYFLDKLPVDFQNRILKWAAVSDWVRGEWQDLLGTQERQRAIDVTPLGIDYWNFHSPIAERLESVGYAGAYRIGHNDHIKRTDLVDRICERSGLPLKVAIQYHNLFTTMQGFYPQVGAVLITSTHEGAGLPALEAAAAGRLVLSTPVGHWERISPTGCIELPLEAEALVEHCAEALSYYKNNPSEYRTRCLQIQEYAKSYDWSAGPIDQWATLLS